MKVTHCATSATGANVSAERRRQAWRCSGVSPSATASRPRWACPPAQSCRIHRDELNSQDATVAQSPQRSGSVTTCAVGASWPAVTRSHFGNGAGVAGLPSVIERQCRPSAAAPAVGDDRLERVRRRAADRELQRPWTAASTIVIDTGATPPVERHRCGDDSRGCRSATATVPGHRQAANVPASAGVLFTVNVPVSAAPATGARPTGASRQCEPSRNRPTGRASALPQMPSCFRSAYTAFDDVLTAGAV